MTASIKSAPPNVPLTFPSNIFGIGGLMPRRPLVIVPSETDAPTGAAEGAWAKAMMEKQVAMLGELAEIGVTMARCVGADATVVDYANPPDMPTLSMAYERVARAVRYSLMLQAKLIEDFQKASVVRAEADKDTVKRIVGRVVKANTRTGNEAYDYNSLVKERLERDDLYGVIADKPFSEVVAMICKDLGLAPDWPRLAEEAWAKAEMAGNRVGEPLAPFAEPRAFAPPPDTPAPERPLAASP